MKKIPLTQGQFALVDDQDYDELSVFKWHAKWDVNIQSFYAMRAINRSGKELMHRRILGLQFGDKLQTDHQNHDTLDNRRSNIRIATSRENMRNRRDQSPHGVGIWFNPKCPGKPFQVYLKKIYGGNFATKQEAILARKRLEVVYVHDDIPHSEQQPITDQLNVLRGRLTDEMDDALTP